MWNYEEMMKSLFIVLDNLCLCYVGCLSMESWNKRKDFDRKLWFNLLKGVLFISFMKFFCKVFERYFKV